MRPPLELQISRSALEKNYRSIRNIVGPTCLLSPCVKGNAYGHGLELVSQVLASVGADGFVVAHLSEALRLRAAGISQPIYLIGAVEPQDAAVIVTEGIHIAVWDIELLQALQQAAEALESMAYAHLTIDTGMARYGLRINGEAEQFAIEALKYNRVKIEGVASHLSSSDEEDEAYTRLQVKKFAQFVHWFRSVGGTPIVSHLANTAGMLRFPDSHFQMVRPGRLIYGYGRSVDDPLLHNCPVEQVLRVTSYIAQVKMVPAGEPIGYSRTYYTNKDTTVAVLPAGYSEGISRFLGNRGEVLVAGKRCEIIGKICMNAMMVDVSNIKGVKKGDEVVCLGWQGEEKISTFEVAALQDTVPYNIITNFQDSLSRVVIE